MIKAKLGFLQRIIISYLHLLFFLLLLNVNEYRRPGVNGIKMISFAVMAFMLFLLVAFSKVFFVAVFLNKLLQIYFFCRIVILWNIHRILRKLIWIWISWENIHSLNSQKISKTYDKVARVASDLLFCRFNFSLLSIFFHFPSAVIQKIIYKLWFFITFERPFEL